eukprot:6928177-Prymnesium_polylepis.1
MAWARLNGTQTRRARGHAHARDTARRDRHSRQARDPPSLPPRRPSGSSTCPGASPIGGGAALARSSTSAAV